MVVTQRTNAEDFTKLIKDSDVHRSWSFEDMKRVIFPLMQINQALFAYKDDKLNGMVTWAWVKPEIANGYLNKTVKLTPEALTGSTGDLWAIDFIAPYGNVKDVIQSFTKRFKELHPEHNSAKMFRRTKDYVSRITLR